MAYHLHRIILIALVLAIADSSSLDDCGGGDPPPVGPAEFDCFNYLKDLCSKTNHTKECWYLIKPQFNRFNKTKDTRVMGVASIVISLVREKAGQIHDLLDKLYDGSKDRNSKFKYMSCSNNYKDAIINLELLKKSLSTYDYDHLIPQVDGVAEELKHCISTFTENSSDPAHIRIRNRNKVFGLYAEFLKVTIIDWIQLIHSD